MTGKRTKDTIQGICPLTAIPFRGDGTVDYQQFEYLLECLCRTGVDGIGLFGVVGEFYKLTDAEKLELARRMIRRLRGRGVFSLISVTDHATEVAVRRAREFQEMGADCLMLLPPHFMNPAPDQIRRHLLEVVQAVEIPVIVQYAPNETGVAISPEELAVIARENDNVLYKIECSDPAAYSTRLLALHPGLSIMNGYWGINLLDMLEIGGKGVMPGFSCCELYVEMYRLYRSGDAAGARAIHQKLAPFFVRWNTSIERVIAIEKELLRRRGMLESIFCRHPGYELQPADLAEADAFMETFGSRLPVFSR